MKTPRIGSRSVSISWTKQRSPRPCPRGGGSISTVPKVFVDANILLYQVDSRDRAKQRTCRDLLKSLVKDHAAVVSKQVPKELYLASTVQLRIAPMLAKGILHGFENSEIVTIGTRLVNEAIDTSVQNQLSFWCSRIVAAAESAKCESPYTEDLNDGQVIRNVKVHNPPASG